MGFFDKVFGGGYAKKAAQEAERHHVTARNEANTILGDLYAQNQQYFQPAYEGGQLALQQQLALAGLQGPEASKLALSHLDADPTFNAGSDYALENMEKVAAARRDMGSGRTQRLLLDMLMQRKENQLQRHRGVLDSLMRFGGGAGSALAGLGERYGANKANNILGIGQARAQGAVGVANAKTAGLNNALSFGGQLLGSVLSPVPTDSWGTSGAY